MIKRIINVSILSIWIFIGILIIAPKVFADNSVSINIEVYNAEGSPLVDVNLTGELGSTASIDFSGLELGSKKFAFYIHNGEMIKEKEKKFLVSQSTYVVAVFKEENQNVAAFVDTNGKMLDIKYSSQESDFKPTSNLAPSKPGYNFDEWNIDENSIISEDIVIKPIYNIISELNKISITVTDGQGSGEYDYNEIVTISSNLQDFTHWEDENGVVVSYSNNYKFSAIKNRTLIAKSGGTESPLVYLQDVSGIRDEFESYLGQVYLPDDYELIQAGLLVSGSVVGDLLNYNKDGYTGDQGHGNFVSKSIHPVTNEFLLSIEKEEDNIRAYAIVKHNDQLLYYESDNAKNKINVTLIIWMDYDQKESITYYGDYYNEDLDLTNKPNESVANNEGNDYNHSLEYKWFGKNPYLKENETEINIRYAAYVEGEGWKWDIGDVVNDKPYITNTIDFKHTYYQFVSSARPFVTIRFEHGEGWGWPGVVVFAKHSDETQLLGPWPGRPATYNEENELYEITVTYDNKDKDIIIEFMREDNYEHERSGEHQLPNVDKEYYYKYYHNEQIDGWYEYTENNG